MAIAPQDAPETTLPLSPLNRRMVDKHSVYLPYIRELGAVTILAMVLYGVWDIIKIEGQLGIDAVHKNTAAINSLIATQDKMVIFLTRLEVTRNASFERRFVGPPYPRSRDWDDPDQ